MVNLYLTDPLIIKVKVMATTKKTSDMKQRIEDTFEDASEYLQDHTIETYDKAIDRLKYEMDRLEREVKHEYRNARRYVRANPEQGVGFAFLTGLVLGVLLTRGGRN